MHRNRGLLPIIRCQHVQSRSAATAAKLKPVVKTYEHSEQFPTAKKWALLPPSDTRLRPRHEDSGPINSQRIPSSKSWARPSDRSRSFRTPTSEHSSQNSASSPRHKSTPSRWSPSSLQPRQDRSQSQMRKNDVRPPSNLSNQKQWTTPLQSGTTSAAETSKTRRSNATGVAEAPTVGNTSFAATEIPYSADYGHDSRRDKKIRPKLDSYKTRGSYLHNLRRGEERATTQGPQKPEQARKPKVHLPRLKPKPRRDVYIPTSVTVGTLARILDVRFDRLIRKMVEAGMTEEASYDHVLTSDYAVLLAEELGRNPVVDDEAAFDLYPPPPHPDCSSLPSRPPIVAIMGHVDHGKTTLLDTLRSSAVAKGEAGGITQHIGAFSVPVTSSQGEQFITFLDTPGHAAFSAMRARGAGITDLVVLVVAADDGIMPQTKEVIKLLEKDTGKVGLVVAINKVDKPEADVEAVKLALLSEGIQLESFGGDVPSVEVSGLTGKGLPDLIETLSAMAELQDLRAEKEGAMCGYVLESKITKGLGPVATVLVLRGSLRTGSHILSGTNQAKVRAMTDPGGKSVKVAHPGVAVTVSGWKTLPKAGDEVLDGKESDVKKALANRARQVNIAASLADVDAINAIRKEERERRKMGPQDEEIATVSSDPKGPKELKLIIKADVSGSAEAVEGALQGIGNKEAMTKAVSSGVGDVTESDVLMAKAIDAAIVAFSVSTPRSVEILAAQNGVPIITSPIIYRLMESVQQRVIALLPTTKETKVTGEATVLQLFDIHLKAKQVKKIAGCRAVNGIIEKARSARIVRDGTVVHEGSLDTMRILKKDVTEVRKGSECGLSFADFADLREGDLIQMYQTVEKPGVL